MTVIEVCLPLLFAAILIALRHRVHSVSHPNATLYPSESVHDLPSFFSSQHASNPWELAYVPSNSSAVQSIAEAVERALPINIRGEQGWGCPFHLRNWCVFTLGSLVQWKVSSTVDGLSCLFQPRPL